MVGKMVRRLKPMAHPLFKFFVVFWLTIIVRMGEWDNIDFCFWLNECLKDLNGVIVQCCAQFQTD